MVEHSGYLAYVGARTTRERGARGDGLNVYAVDSEGRFEHLQLVGDLVNPSFLAFDRTGRYCYTVHGDKSEVSALRIDEATGLLELLGTWSTEGENPVHLAFDPTNRFLVVANYKTSTVALLARNDDGTLAGVIDLLALEGAIGPHRVEQPFPEPHHVPFDPAGNFIYAPDKGLDVVHILRIDAAEGRLVHALPPVRTREGSGPRHITFHPNARFAYVMNELDSTVTAYRCDKTSGALEPFQLLSSLPEDYTGDSRAAEIELSRDGRFLFASNRGHESIASFALDPTTGALRHAGWQREGLAFPRYFTMDPTGRFVVVANEFGDTIWNFAIDPANGTLSPAGEAAHCGSPVCVLFRKLA